ncbi:MAG TPA: hypothetical protein VH143_31265 [Kofleriaceae bacterium]|jgi:uncharacterized protein (TIGR00290 family)|nr:hypothetical protein [Kofleriaceae bacterium]
MSKPRAVVSWSSGKDSAFALHVARLAGELELVGLVTTVTTAFGRVAMHGVRDALLALQVDAIGLPCRTVAIPSPCPNEVYERELFGALAAARDAGVTHVVFGDLFLADIRAYREALLGKLGMTCAFPLWHRDTSELAREMIAAGLRANLTCVDPRQLDASFAGRSFDAALLAALPATVDPCGERGEFHTFVSAGPMFLAPIRVVPGEVVERDGFVFADLLPA